jgi:hypothetical protein
MRRGRWTIRSYLRGVAVEFGVSLFAASRYRVVYNDRAWRGSLVTASWLFAASPMHVCRVRIARRALCGFR